MTVLVVALSLRSRIETIGVVILPLAAVVGLLATLQPQASHSVIGAAGQLGLQLHIISSLLAYSLLSVAALQAVFLALQNTRLRRQHSHASSSPRGPQELNRAKQSKTRRWANNWLVAMPPMQSMEIWLFQLISAGFLLLSLSLASGLIFVNDAFAQHLIHKLVFSAAAWLVFAVLLWGRWRYGWRGKRAVRFTLLGCLLLALAYFGSKWVLEILLNTSWS